MSDAIHWAPAGEGGVRGAAPRHPRAANSTIRRRAHGRPGRHPYTTEAPPPCTGTRPPLAWRRHTREPLRTPEQHLLRSPWPPQPLPGASQAGREISKSTRGRAHAHPSRRPAPPKPLGAVQQNAPNACMAALAMAPSKRAIHAWSLQSLLGASGRTPIVPTVESRRGRFSRCLLPSSRHPSVEPMAPLAGCPTQSKPLWSPRCTHHGAHFRSCVLAG